MTFGCDFCLGLLVVIFVCDFWLELGIGMVVAGDLDWVVTFVVTCLNAMVELIYFL